MFFQSKSGLRSVSRRLANLLKLVSFGWVLSTVHSADQAKPPKFRQIRRRKTDFSCPVIPGVNDAYNLRLPFGYYTGDVLCAANVVDILAGIFAFWHKFACICKNVFCNRLFNRIKNRPVIIGKLYKRDTKSALEI